MPVGVYARPRRKGPLSWPTARPSLAEPPVLSPVVLTIDGDVTLTHLIPAQVNRWSCPDCGRSFRRSRDGHWVLAPHGLRGH